MNKREAKRAACAFLAGHIDGGIVRLTYVDEDLSKADNDKVKAALEELLDEMLRRSGNP